MNILQRLATAITTKSDTPRSDWVSSSDRSNNRRYASTADRFDNIYDNAIALAKGFARISPYLSDKNGKRVKKQSNILDAIYAPVTGMSDYQFRKTLALMTITHDEYYILIHTSGDSFLNKPSEDNITGYEIVQPWDVSKVGDIYSVSADGSIIPVSDKRLMRMTDVLDPFDLSRGYSTMRAVRKWAELDDFIADYQSGLFAGGAVPQGIFDIVATIKDYETIRRRIESTIRNNNGNGGVLFNHIPVNSQGQSQEATITWRPMSSTNKEMQTDTLLTNNNRKKDTYFGVPEEIRGYLQNSNYASVRIAEFVMTEYSVRDLALAIWSKFTSELNRCTGGFGAAITFDLETPLVADEEKIKAETETINLTNIFKLVDRGYALSAAVKALALPERYANLGEVAAAVQDDDPAVQETGEADDNPDDSASKKALAAKSADTTFKQSSVNLKKWQEKIEIAAKNSQQLQVDAAIAGIEAKKADGDGYTVPDGQYYYDDDSKLLFEVLVVATLAALMISGAKDTSDANKLLATIGLDTNLSDFTAGDKKVARLVKEYAAKPTTQTAQAAVAAIEGSKSTIIVNYKTRIDALAKSYGKETASLIAKTIDEAISNGLSASELTASLKAIGLDEARSKRLAETEIHRARNTATEHTINRLQSETGEDWEKSAYSKTGSPCTFCEAQIGKWVPSDGLFVAKGETMISTDGQERINDYEDIGQAAFHPNCHCGLQARLVL